MQVEFSIKCQLTSYTRCNTIACFISTMTGYGARDCEWAYESRCVADKTVTKFIGVN